jgi:hypothetical protein
VGDGEKINQVPAGTKESFARWFSADPPGLKFFWTINPRLKPLAIFFHASGTADYLPMDSD